MTDKEKYGVLLSPIRIVQNHYKQLKGQELASDEALKILEEKCGDILQKVLRFNGPNEEKTAFISEIDKAILERLGLKQPKPERPKPKFHQRESELERVMRNFDPFAGHGG